MLVSPVERPVASAAYGFVRFIGGGLAPFAAGKLVEHYNTHVPFIIGAGAVALAAAVLSTVHGVLEAADSEEAHDGPSVQRHDAEAAVGQVPGLEEEAVLAQRAVAEDRSLNQGHPS
jgi:hypothetical protein